VYPRRGESVVRKAPFSKRWNDGVWLGSIIVVVDVVVWQMEVVAAVFENHIHARGIEIYLLRFVSIAVSLFRQPSIPPVSRDYTAGSQRVGGVQAQT
jgi:hypothetical protein